MFDKFLCVGFGKKYEPYLTDFFVLSQKILYRFGGDARGFVPRITESARGN
jgi:hypothetical protein